MWPDELPTLEVDEQLVAEFERMTAGLRCFFEDREGFFYNFRAYAVAGGDQNLQFHESSLFS